MKASIIRKGIAMALIASLIACLGGCTKKFDPSTDDAFEGFTNENLPEVSSFYVSKSGSWGDGEAYSFEVEYNKKGEIKKVSGHVKYGTIENDFTKPAEKSFTLPNEDYELLCYLVKVCNVKSWDGFNKSDPDVMDGWSFSCKVSFKDGSSSDSCGYMITPNNFSRLFTGTRAIFQNHAPEPTD